MAEKKLGKVIGEVEHFFSKIGVGIIKVKESIKVGDKIKIKGHTTDIEMSVDSMQIDHKDAAQAGAGDSVGIRVPQRVRRGDMVYLVKP